MTDEQPGQASNDPAGALTSVSTTAPGLGSTTATTGALSSSGSRPRVTIAAEAGEFYHQAEDAEAPCVTPRGAAACACGAYELDWAREPGDGRSLTR